MCLSCCLSTMCCNALCSICGSSRKLYSRIGYVLFSIIWLLACLVMLHYGAKLFPVLKYFLSCSDDEMSYEACVGIYSVYRISFSLCLFHLIMFLACLFQNEVIAAFNEGAWPIKFVLVGGVFVVTYSMSNTFFYIYGVIATVASILFLLYEVILLIDIAYAWNKSWTEQYAATESSTWEILLVASTGVIYATGLIIMTRWLFFGMDWANTCNVLGTLVISLLFAVVSLSPLVEKGSLLTCALFFAFNMLMCGTLVSLTPKNEMWTGLTLAFVALIYVSVVTVSKEEGKDLVKGISAQVMEAAEEYERVEEAESQPEVTLATGLYHLLMMFASMYYAMALTNWGAFTKDESSFVMDKFGYRVRLFTQWIANGLFAWSLIAPRLFPGRDFS